MIAILGKYYQCNSCYWKLEQYWVKWLCVHSRSIIILFNHKIIRALLCINFSQICLIVTRYSFLKLKIQTLTSNTFKNQTNDSLKLFDHNGTHQRGIGAQNITVLHCCGFKLKFLKVACRVQIWKKSFLSK